MTRAAPPALPRRPFLYPILDLERLRARGVAELVAALAAGGARIVQVRGKLAADAELLAAAEAAVAAARPLGVLSVIDDRPDVALLSGADGVHLGQSDLPAAAVRRLLPGAILGVSTHGEEQLRQPDLRCADYVAVGPVYPTATKRDPDPVVGLELVARARRLTGKPLVAIGGITAARAAAVVAAGADGLAVISDLLDAPDLAAALDAYRRALAACR